MISLEEYKKEYHKCEFPLIAIVGPTASGKTNLSLRIYEEIHSEIISADSRQIYKQMNIGTAKPSQEILEKYPHHLIDFLDLYEDYSVGKYVKDAQNVISQLYSQDKLPIISGGTGLYIDSLCSDFFSTNFESTNLEIRNTLSDELKRFGTDYLYNKLAEVDKKSAEKYNDKNPRRILRALEFYYSTGMKFSDAQEEFTTKSKYSTIYFGINYPREELYSRIDKRVELMIADGFVREVQEILDSHYSAELNSLNTVGYKEIIKYLEGEYSLDFAISEIQKNTRRYAKRQLTWFRRNQNIFWIEPKDLSNFSILNFLQMLKYEKTQN
jgi:tRNA dimethylallyltransferase